MESRNLVLVVFVPVTHADAVRQALGEAGAGTVGDYDHCSFSSLGTGRFRAGTNTKPAIGEAGKHESVEEERIEAIVPREIIGEVVERVKSAHPYEEVPFYSFAIEDL